MHKDYVLLRYSLGKLSCQIFPVYLISVSYNSNQVFFPFFIPPRLYAGAAACPSSSSKSLRQVPKGWQIRLVGLRS